MQNELQRILDLAKKTGDRVVVFDHFDNGKTYVVMGLDEYEGIVENAPNKAGGSSPEASAKGGLTESELLDKINGDIAQWKNRSDFNIPEESKQQIKQETEAIKTVSNERPPMQNKNSVRSKNWSIPKTIKEAAEQVMEEDKPYSDEVSF